MITIDRSFNGPPDSGNGGYVCGAVAEHIEGTATIMLKVPPPLGVPMDVEPNGGGVRLVHDGVEVAVGKPDTLELTVPPPVHLAAAEEASRHYAGFTDHLFSTCFVCGPDRHEGDGLRIFAGPVGGVEGLVAAPWVPHAHLAGADGAIPNRIIWAALDCPGAFAISRVFDAPILLGSLTAEIIDRPVVGEPCVAMGWPLGVQGRKHFSGTAIIGADGRTIGKAKAVWIRLKAEEAAA